MAKLTRRYDPYEFETLVMCIKPVERWTVNERKSWVKTQIGFRHFQASNVVPIEHAEAADGLFQPALEACRLILSYTRYALYTPPHVDARTNASDLRGPAGGGEYEL
jgi:hypothetical protein